MGAINKRDTIVARSAEYARQPGNAVRDTHSHTHTHFTLFRDRSAGDLGWDIDVYTYMIYSNRFLLVSVNVFFTSQLVFNANRTARPHLTRLLLS